ncbi:ARS binding protein 2-domain-containing protein [Aspergillus cavernicola]|uniref:ARS binding protein 2-domain-containing protein n=1 Tax=Aspergillus cavernicola TaxID=176166 RepID=A0ABR4I1Z6_9EURO
MQGAFPTMVNQPERNELGGPPMVVQQYARYPSSMEVGLQSASSIGSAHSQLANSKSPPLHRKATPRSLQASPTVVPRPAVPPGPPARSGPSMSPPVFDSLRQRHTRDAIDQADPRALPSRDITDENIDNAYILFIFYCNPNVPLSADSTELRKTFRCPPRSDGKSFSVFTLWELIKRLDSKELKTWIQLAIELGVEPPDMEKKQSTQKVQQYAVRLKRWMRAMHVDAFFEYCLGHQHPYYTQLPANNAVVSDSRDGVPLEEDLALRALVPQWKPKRGRKRAEEKDNSSERLVKRPQVDTSVGVFQAGSFPTHSAFPQSAIPFSAFPDDMESTDPWMTTSSFPTDGVASDAPGSQPGQDLRWKSLDREASPAVYPQSAVIPRGHHTSDVFLTSAEPRSAVTPSSGEKTRAKRRHGPAVSSAWPNNTTSSTGKMRGRPPNRGTVSGPFSSFPVNPNRSDPSHLHSTGVRPSPTIVLEQDPTGSQYHQSPTPVNMVGKPSKLQLQVPQHSGAPVRLATPPTLLLNGVGNPSASMKSEIHQRNGTTDFQADVPGGIAVANPSSNVNRSGVPNTVVTPDHVARILSGELLRARLTGRQTPLSAEEAGALALVVVTNLTVLYAKLPFGAAALTTALHLGLGPYFGYSGVTSSTLMVHIEPRAATTGAPGISGADGRFPTSVYKVSLEYSHASRFSTRVAFENIYIGSANNNITMATSTFDNTPRQSDELDNSAELDSLTDAEYEVDNTDGTISETTWKQRYQKLKAQMQKRERSLSQYKRKILESVMADI